MNTSPTIVDSYPNLPQSRSDVGKSLAPTLSNKNEQFSIIFDNTFKRGYRSYATKTACIIGIATAVSMPVQASVAPSQINLYPSVYESKNYTQTNHTFPPGYEIINGSNIGNYLNKHPSLRDFLYTNLDTFQNIAGTDNLSLEYDGMAEEGWESLFLIVHLDSEDDENTNTIEDALFNNLLNDAPEEIINNLTVSFA